MKQDEFVYLEDLNNLNTKKMISEAKDRVSEEFCNSDDYKNLVNDIKLQLQSEKLISFSEEHQAKMYHFYQNEMFPKGVYRVCSAASYRSGMPNWKILFSIEEFDEKLNDDVFFSGISHNVESPNKVLLMLSQAGTDAVYTLELDLETCSLVEDGFHFPPSKSHISWRDADSVWVCPAWDEDQLTESGYPRQAWLLNRGQTTDEMHLIYEINKKNVAVNAWRYLDAKGAPIDLIESSNSFFSKDYFVIDSKNQIFKLNLPSDCEISGYLSGQLIIKLPTGWRRSNNDYPVGSLIAVKLNKAELGHATLLFEPNNKQAIEDVETSRNHIISTIVDNVSIRIQIWMLKEGEWVEKEIPDYFPTGTVTFVDQPWGGDIINFAVNDFTSPLTLYSLDMTLMELVILRKEPKVFDDCNVKTVQYQAVSADGTNIPYYYIGENKFDIPTIVYVYGGFGESELPHYLGMMGRHWLSEGYSFVVANVRGGGEFGEQWHKSAQGYNKYKSVDDLLAVVEDLQFRKLSSYNKIILQGGSNGGIIVASAFVRSPTKIAGMVCEVPLTDMLRYTKLYAGSSWIDEYGNPENPNDRIYLEKFSPYHQLREKIDYPPSLITTSLTDDRVHPAHALKFYSKLRSMNIDCSSWLYIDDCGGHAGNSTQQSIAKQLACILIFMKKIVKL